MNITKLEPNQIFVFGSNLTGNHTGGAAAQAVLFGAEHGIGEGMTGQCYAFPTLTESMEQVSDDALIASRDRLFATCAKNKDKQFLMTKVGCGIAGFSEEKMKKLFVYDTPTNLVLPDGWNRRLFKFLLEGMRSEYGDCRWAIGEEKIGKNPKCCEAGGYHASRRIIDAIKFVQGPILAEVEVNGLSDVKSEKECWERMTVVRTFDWSPIKSVKMAIFSAESVLGIFEKKYPNDTRPRVAIEAAKAYISNPTDAADAADAAYAAYAAYAADAADAADAAREKYIRSLFTI